VNKDEIFRKNENEYETLREYEMKILQNINNNKVFEDIPETKDILGDFLDKVIGRSMYLYKNRYIKCL
jgi:hypothetical protein